MCEIKCITGTRFTKYRINSIYFFTSIKYRESLSSSVTNVSTKHIMSYLLE